MIRLLAKISRILISPDNLTERALKLTHTMMIALLTSLLHSTASAQMWAQPKELRGKKLIDTGIYTMDSSPIPLNSRTLPDHPEFTKTHPFDGIALRAALDPTWCEEMQRPYQGRPDINAETHLDGWIWSKQAVPWDAIKPAVDDLKRVQWGSLTDNFLWCNTRGGDTVFRADLTNDDDWQGVEHNAKMMGRLCKQAGLKGLLLDTEQYSRYEKTGEPFPWGRGSSELMRDRGRRWMQALQSEAPDIRIIIFFAWSPDLDAADFLKGVKDFLDGMLAGIEPPARLIHGYENTFYYGQTAGTRHTAEGFRGDRARYIESRDTMRGWRSLSNNPEKFDRVVEVGMAAWLEGDPWNLWGGWPSGSRDNIWSNVPMALVASDEYVWCWSEHSNYFHQRSGDSVNLSTEQWLNPYLASLTNQTFNRGDEQVASLVENFFTDPLLMGWYFDYDMLAVSRKQHTDHAIPIFSRDAVPYRWSEKKRALIVEGTWLAGSDGRQLAQYSRERRRFVHPVQTVTTQSQLECLVDFTIDDFGENPENPIVLGLFNSDLPTIKESLTLRIRSADSVHLVLTGNQAVRKSAPGRSLTTDRMYRASLISGPNADLQVTLIDLTDNSSLCELNGSMDRAGEFHLNEVGIAFWGGEKAVTPTEKAYQYRVHSIQFTTKKMVD